LIEETGWTWDELLDQPADLIDEMLIRIGARNMEQNKRIKEQNRAKGRGR